MKICLSWLSDYVDLSGHDPGEVGRILTMGIAEVEGVHAEASTGETVLEVDNKSLTHRPDLWGHVGIARELAAILGRPFRHPVPDGAAPAAAGADGSGLAVEVAAPDLCPRYTALVIEGIRVGPSPGWLVRRLQSVGVRPISNVVDLTNYVMLELGQPLHAFDIRKLRGPRIVVRRAAAGERITTLDGVARTLTADDLLIADAERGIALAGVMGSADSEIDGATTTLVLESATFHPVSTRLTAARVGLRTEACMRFEKSLDPELPPVAARRFVELLANVLPEARTVGPLHDSAPGPRPLPTIALSTSFASRRLGTELAPGRIDAILRSLSFGVARRDDEHAEVTVPSFRATKDVAIPEDLVEELGRIHGYGNIPPQAPAILMAPQPRNDLRAFERLTKTHLTSGLGFDEVTLYSFQSSRGIRVFGLDPSRMLALENPLSEECAHLKRSLVPDVLLLLPRNAGLDRFRLFEYGRAYLKDDPMLRGALPREERRLVALVYDKAWRAGAAAFQEIRGALGGLASRLMLEEPVLEALRGEGLAAHPWAHPGRAAGVSLGGKAIGMLAEVHPKVMTDLGVTGRAAYLDVDLEAMLRAGPRAVAFQELPRFPSVTIDVTFLCPRRTPAADVRRQAATQASAIVRTLEVLGVYEGAGLPEGTRTVTLRLLCRADDRTLTEPEAQAERERLVAHMAGLGFPVR